jgi:hypothetical protein
MQVTCFFRLALASAYDWEKEGEKPQWIKIPYLALG